MRHDETVYIGTPWNTMFFQTYLLYTFLTNLFNHFCATKRCSKNARPSTRIVFRTGRCVLGETCAVRQPLISPWTPSNMGWADWQNPMVSPQASMLGSNRCATPILKSINSWDLGTSHDISGRLPSATERPASPDPSDATLPKGSWFSISWPPSEARREGLRILCLDDGKCRLMCHRGTICGCFKEEGWSSLLSRRMKVHTVHEEYVWSPGNSWF